MGKKALLKEAELVRQDTVSKNTSKEVLSERLLHENAVIFNQSFN